MVVRSIARVVDGQAISFQAMYGMILFCCAGHVHAGRITLAWDGSVEPILGGYSLYYGHAHRAYAFNIDVGNATSHTLTGLHCGTTYYFAVRAYDTTKTIWSDFSNEVREAITNLPPRCDDAEDSSGLVAAYDFEEAGGSRVIDASNQGNHGILDGAVRISQGRFGKALSFDGIDDWVTVNDAASLDLTAGITLEAWVHPTDSMTGWRSVLLKDAPPEHASYYLAANSDANRPAVGVFISNNQSFAVGPQLALYTWAHLAGTYDGITLRLYLNGSEVARRAQPGPIEASDGVLRIGGNGVWGEFFNGQLDEIRIYNRALSATEIRADMDAPIATSTPPAFLIGYPKKGSVLDRIPRGKALAFQSMANHSGWVTRLSIYVDKGSSAKELVAGLYSNKNGHPRELLAQGTLRAPRKQGWKQVAIPPAYVRAGRTYWIAILSRRGTLKFRHRSISAGARLTISVQGKLAALPRRWKTGSIHREGSLSGYGAGHR